MTEPRCLIGRAQDEMHRPTAMGGDWVVERHQAFHLGRRPMPISSSVFVATGVDDHPPRAKKRITCFFLVDRWDTPRFHRARTDKTIRSATGLTRTASSEFDTAACPAGQVLGEVDGGFRRWMNTWLYATRLTVAAFFRSSRRGAVFDLAVDYAAERADKFGLNRSQSSQGP